MHLAKGAVMRNAFARQITELAAHDERVVLLMGDIGNRLFDDFRSRFPARFFNAGVAEANMMGVAAGMALSGLRPVVYTIAPFVTTRCLEQIRVDVCYHQAPVVIVGVGAGLSYASLGATHQSCEDIAFLRMLPGMTVCCPADPLEVMLALKAAVAHEGPVYLRLGKKGEPGVHGAAPDFRLGKAIVLKAAPMHARAALIVTGNMAPTALAVAGILENEGLSLEVIHMHTVKPLDEPCLREAFTLRRLVVTLEEHSRLGGLGGAVAEWLSDQPRGEIHAALVRIGTADRFFHEAGDQPFARRLMGLDAASIADTVRAALAG